MNRSLLICAVAAIASGCASTSKMAKPLTDFTAATTEATRVTTAALTTVQAVDQDSQAIERSLAEKTPQSLREQDVKQILRPDDLLQRQLALQALSTYAATLKALSTVDKSADIQKGFDSLGTSLESTAGNIRKLGDSAATPLPNGVVSGLVKLGGNVAKAYAGHEREEAIRVALEKGNEQVVSVCELLATELGPRGPIYIQVEHDFRIQEQAADNKYKAALPHSTADQPKIPVGVKAPGASAGGSSGDKTGTDDKPSPSATPDLVPFFKGFAALKSRKDYSLALLNSLASSYRKISQAHNALKLQSESGAPSSAQLRSLAAEIDTVKFFNSQIAK